MLLLLSVPEALYTLEELLLGEFPALMGILLALYTTQTLLVHKMLGIYMLEDIAIQDLDLETCSRGTNYNLPS
jgi:hypothetical protein